MNLGSRHTKSGRSYLKGKIDNVFREFKHDVYGKRQTAKITSDFLFFSCNP